MKLTNGQPLTMSSDIYSYSIPHTLVLVDAWSVAIYITGKLGFSCLVAAYQYL